MMAFEGPYLASIIARLPFEKLNLAAYGIALAFGLIIEAPIMMIMSASAALIKGGRSYRDLKRFLVILNLILTSVIIFICIPQIFYFIAYNLLGLNSEVAKLAHIATILLIPWPGSIGYRRFYQGILIKDGLTKYVALGTVFRLIFMSVVGLIFYHIEILPGAAVGGLSMSAGVVAEAIAARIMANSSVLKLKEIKNDETLELKRILTFYIPLALTPLIALGVYPAVTFFLGKSIMAIESLAVMPVINSLVFIFRSLGLSYQEVVVALGGKSEEHFKYVKNFAFFLGMFTLFMMIIISFTDLSFFWFHKVSGLPVELSKFAIVPTMIMSAIPAGTVLLSFQRGALVNCRYTNPITIATIVEAAVIVLSLTVFIKWLHVPGVILASTSLLLGRITSTSFLFIPLIKCLKKMDSN
jgi:hypothetical protein